jgi:hypothetical protein
MCFSVLFLRPYSVKIAVWQAFKIRPAWAKFVMISFHDVSAVLL